MEQLYFDEHIALQNEFGTRKLADMLDTKWAHRALTPEEQAFVASRDMFFLATVDKEGRPTVSYKGGPVGLVNVVDDHTLAFPGFDGNGMFYSMGNIVGQGHVGLLFIDFETPHRFRVQGRATFERDDPLMGTWKEAKYIVRVTCDRVWVNCPRYVHKYQRVGQSKYVPVEGKETPLALWKRADIVQEVIKPEERAQAEKEGILTLPEYEERVMRGDN
jgi:predicted pyridoxine 5'-phosphate oxidase superfamily flavin-nucleotide-binding protein